MKQLYSLTKQEFENLKKLKITGTYLADVLDKFYCYHGENSMNVPMGFITFPNIYLYCDIDIILNKMEELSLPWSKMYSIAKENKMIQLQCEIKRLNPEIIIPAYLSKINRIDEPYENVPEQVLDHFGIKPVVTCVYDA